MCFLYDDESKLYFESEEAISGCFNNYLNISNLNGIGQPVARHCTERPSPKSTVCVPRLSKDYDCIVSNCIQTAVFENAFVRNSVVKAGESTSYFCYEVKCTAHDLMKS